MNTFLGVFYIRFDAFISVSFHLKKMKIGFNRILNGDFWSYSKKLKKVEGERKREIFLKSCEFYFLQFFRNLLNFSFPSEFRIDPDFDPTDF